MPEYYRSIKVALLGEWPEGEKEVFRKKLGEYKEANFGVVGSVSPTKSGLLPDGFERLEEVRLAHELSIAKQCNMVVYGNSGVWGRIKKMHMKQLHETCGVLVCWTPTDVNDPIPPQGEMVPGVVQVHGRIELLHRIVAYLALGHRTGGVELGEQPVDKENAPDPSDGWADG